MKKTLLILISMIQLNLILAETKELDYDDRGTTTLILGVIVLSVTSSNDEYSTNRQEKEYLAKLRQEKIRYDIDGTIGEYLNIELKICSEQRQTEEDTCIDQLEFN